MQMSVAFVLLFFSFVIASIVGFLVRPIGASLLRLRFWVALGAASVFLSACSAFYRVSDGSGTGTRTSYGWPKAFYFHWKSWEGPEEGQGIDILFMLGNSMFYAAVLLAGWLAYRLATAFRHRGASREAI